MAKQKQQPRQQRSTRRQVDVPEFWFYAIILAAIGVFVYKCFRFDFTQDDAYISFRYAANFLAGKGLVYNYGEHVEGYTNFLWVMILALFKGLAGIDYLITSRFFGVVSGAGIFYLLYLLLKHHFSKPSFAMLLALMICLVFNQSLPYWSIASLETAAFAFMALATLVAEYRASRMSFAFAIVATLLRPEGALVFGVILIDRIIRDKEFPLAFFLCYLIPLIPFAIFKLSFYGALFPNPFYAKSGVGFEYMATGVEYLWYFTSTVGVFGVLFLFPLLAIKNLWSKYSLLYLYVFLYIAYIVWVGGDVLKVYRFFVPVVPVLYFLFVVSLHELFAMLIKNRRLVVTGATIIVLVFSWTSYQLAQKHVHDYWIAEENIISKMRFMGVMLSKHMGKDFSLATTTIGMVGYQLLGHRIIDMLGLTDSYIAHNPEKVEGITSSWKERRFNSEYLLKQQPDFILFSTGYKPSAPAERVLLLHSEFRKKYHISAFQREQNYKVIWSRFGAIDMTTDTLITDMQFVNSFSDGFYHLNKTSPQKALEVFLDARRRLGVDYPVLSYVIGDSYDKQKRYDSARVYFDKAIGQDSMIWEPRLKLCQYADARHDTATVEFHIGYLQTHMPWLFDKSYVPPKNEIADE